MFYKGQSKSEFSMVILIMNQNLFETDRAAGPAVVLLAHHGEGLAALHALHHVLEQQQVGLPLADLYSL